MYKRKMRELLLHSNGREEGAIQTKRNFTFSSNSGAVPILQRLRLEKHYWGSYARFCEKLIWCMKRINWKIFSINFLEASCHRIASHRRNLRLNEISGTAFELRFVHSRRSDVREERIIYVLPVLSVHWRDKFALSTLIRHHAAQHRTPFRHPPVSSLGFHLAE